VPTIKTFYNKRFIDRRPNSPLQERVHKGPKQNSHFTAPQLRAERVALDGGDPARPQTHLSYAN